MAGGRGALQAPRGHLGAPDLPGHLAWALVPCTRTTSNSSLVLSLSPNPCSPDPRRPPGLWSCCPPSPATLTAIRRDNRKPSTRPRRTCFYLLRVGGTQHVEGREPPTPHPPPAQDWTPGGTALGWRLLWRQRVKAKLPGLHPSPIQADVLANPQHLAFSNLILALLQKLEEKNSCPLALRKQFGPPPPAMSPPGHCEDPCPSGTLGHPVRSTLSPPPIVLSSQLFRYYIHKITPHTLYPAPAPVPKGGRNRDQSATRVKFSTCPCEGHTSESSSRGAGQRTLWPAPPPQPHCPSDSTLGPEATLGATAFSKHVPKTQHRALGLRASSLHRRLGLPTSTCSPPSRVAFQSKLTPQRLGAGPLRRHLPACQNSGRGEKGEGGRGAWSPGEAPGRA